MEMADVMFDGKSFSIYQCAIFTGIHCAIGDGFGNCFQLRAIDSEGGPGSTFAVSIIVCPVKVEYSLVVRDRGRDSWRGYQVIRGCQGGAEGFGPWNSA